MKILGGANLFVVPVALLFFAGEPRAASAQQWQAEWARALEGAKREGQVNVFGPPGDVYRDALTLGFKKAHPDVTLEFTGVHPRDMIARIVKERQAGTYQWDVYISGPTSAMRVLKPQGAFDPLRPALIRPEVLDDSKWLGGFQDGFVDSDRKIFYAFDGTLSQTLHVNRDVVPAGEFHSAKQLLDPKWAGKIVWEDPRQEGAGLNAGLVFSLSFGEDFLRRLLREQKIVYTNDRRQMTEWLVRGRHPIAIALGRDILIVFQEKGLGRAVEAVEADLMNSLIPGFGAVALMNRHPHPNAAKLYLNWLLSPDGQAAWAQVSQRNSRRLDVPPGDPNLKLPPGVKYMNTQTESMLPQRQRVSELAKELIP